jgi:hypothetical protein
MCIFIFRSVARNAFTAIFLSFAGCDSATMADYLAALEHEIQAAGSLPTAQVPCRPFISAAEPPAFCPRRSAASAAGSGIII